MLQIIIAWRWDPAILAEYFLCVKQRVFRLPARRPWFLVCSQVVEVDRSFQIDAAIVRIMKMRRRFAHEKLVSETTEQLLSHFHADPKQIKRRIEHLIEREYAPPWLAIDKHNPPAHNP